MSGFDKARIARLHDVMAEHIELGNSGGLAWLAAELSAIPGARLDYARVVDAETLQPLARLDRPAVAAVAVYLGTTRLIDNLQIADCGLRIAD